MFPRALPNEAALDHNVQVKLLIFAYTALCIAAGGYVTAWIARRSPVVHAIVMGAIQVGLTIWAMIEIPEKAPRWFWIAGMMTIIPAAWLGGALRARQSKVRTYRGEEQ